MDLDQPPILGITSKRNSPHTSLASGSVSKRMPNSKFNSSCSTYAEKEKGMNT